MGPRSSYLELDQHRPTFEALLELFHGSLQGVGTLRTFRENGLWEELVQIIFRFDIREGVDSWRGQERVCLAVRQSSGDQFPLPKLPLGHLDAEDLEHLIK